MPLDAVAEIAAGRHDRDRQDRKSKRTTHDADRVTAMRWNGGAAQTDRRKSRQDLRFVFPSDEKRGNSFRN
jgi:hypothetical protein